MIIDEADVNGDRRWVAKILVYASAYDGLEAEAY